MNKSIEKQNNKQKIIDPIFADTEEEMLQTLKNENMNKTMFKK